MRILLVEDETAIAAFIRQGLEEEGFSVDVANDGVSGAKMGTAGKYGLILLDWMLPLKKGIEVCTELRSAGIQTPILFLTSRDTLQDTIAGLKAGANDYIKKPFHFEELLERIRIHFREELMQNLELGTIRIDKAAHRVWDGETEIKLTPKEFELLGYLVGHKGKVCSREDIIREVWDIHFDYDSGVIDVHMNGLRKKLPSLSGNQLIETIRGVGFIAREHEF